MKKVWIFEKDFDIVSSQVLSFRCPGIELIIQPLEMTADILRLGCYIPTIPRLTSIISGKILLRRLPDHRTELRAFDFEDWAIPFLQSLVRSISDREDDDPQ